LVSTERAGRVVVYDACVLFPAALRDLLVRLGITGLLQPRWSEQILDEVFRNIPAVRPDVRPEALVRTRILMNRALPRAMVTGVEARIEMLGLPDPDDRHVLAAAIEAGAESIITFNLRDFPETTMALYGITAEHPDDLLRQLVEADHERVLQVIMDQASALKHPPTSLAQLLDTLEKQGLKESVVELRRLFLASEPKRGVC
jgi:predicted nucleic acid-binding protein